MKKTIVIDPGHGGRDSGAVGPNGAEEKSVNLSIARVVLNLLELESKHIVLLTREGNNYVSLTDRADFSNSANADLFISIHANASPQHTANGYEVFTSPGPTDADRMATLLMRNMAAEFPDRKARMDIQDGDPDKEAKFFVLMKTKAPAVLFETGFIDNIEGEKFLTNRQNQDRLAKVIVRAVLEFFPETRDVGPELDRTIVDLKNTKLRLEQQIDDLIKMRQSL